MALKAGRVGVAPDQVDPYGKISGGGGGYVLPTASDTTLGGIKVGNGLTMTDGVLSSDNPTPYSLPTASDATLGGIKVGSGLTMTDGVLSSDNPTPYSLPTASDSALGGIKVGSGLTITDGVLSASSGGAIFKLWKVLSDIKGGTPAQMKQTIIGNNTSYPIPSGYTPITAIAYDKPSGYIVGAILATEKYYNALHYCILSWSSNENIEYDVYVILAATSAFESYTP